MKVERSRIDVRRSHVSLCIAAVLGAGLTASIAGAASQRQPSTGTIAARPLVGPPERRITGNAAHGAQAGPSRSAGVVPVTSCEDDESPGTLRVAAAAAASGDTLDLTTLACSTITLLSGQIEIDVDDLTIEGPGSATLTIDGNQASNNSPIENGRVFLHNGSGTLTIEQATLANGLVYSFSAYGGCINSANGTVTLNDVIVTGCRAVAFGPGAAAHGGGIAAGNSTGGGGISLNGSVVSGNQAVAKFNLDYNFYGYTSAGGGISSRGTITVTNSQITNNRVEAYLPFTEDFRFQQAAGGGISAYFMPVTISGSVVSNNFAGCDTATVQCYNAVAGAIRALGGLTIEDSTMTGNVAQATSNVISGGIEVEGLSVQISRSAISNNSGVELKPGRNWGGGLELSNATVEIFDSTISGNSASRGGGIFLDNTPLTLSNSTISGNAADDQGGGVFVSTFGAAALIMGNSTVTLNSSTGDAGGGGVVDATNRAGASTLQSSIVAGNTVLPGAHMYDADLGVAFGEVDGANDLIVAASGVTLPPDTLSADPMLGPLQDNGGPTWTHALLPGSAAIDAGNNVANLDFDQRGEGFLRRSGSAVDIGAFELQTTNDDVIFADGFDGASPK